MINVSEIQDIYSDWHIYIVLKNGQKYTLSYNVNFALQKDIYIQKWKIETAQQKYIKRLAKKVIEIKKALALN